MFVSRVFRFGVVGLTIHALAAIALCQVARPCDHPQARQFDFWLGAWALTWPAEQTGGKPGTLAHGTNHVRLILDSCIVEESFAGGDYRGRSLSAYNPRQGLWEQTWVDNQGNYLTFQGSFHDGIMELRSTPAHGRDQTRMARMLFHHIQKDRFLWSYQRSTDGGGTWQDVWTIRYRRLEKPR